MENITIDYTFANNTTDACFAPLLWNQSSAARRYPRVYICSIAAVIHAIFWLQLALCASVRQSSMQWIYSYLVTDVLLIIRFFWNYIVRTQTTDCNPSRAWVVFMCYFEATVDNYLNIIEVYILLALNICRYIQIAYNQNVYRLYKKSLVLSHLGIYFGSLLILVVPYLFGWSVVNEYPKDRCETVYTNDYIQAFNMIFAFSLPILLNIGVIYLSVRHVNLVSGLQRGQHHLSARQKYHRTLVIQFLVFYIIWLSLWSPNIIIYQVTYSSPELTATFRLINYIEIAIDPFILAALDVRFWQAWKQSFVTTKNSLMSTRTRTVQGRVQPSTTAPRVFSTRTGPAKTTGV